MKAIVAMAENRVIGYKGKIPWYLSEDLQFFKKTTLEKIVVMGRKTYESIGHPLPKRQNIVLSRREKAQKQLPGAPTPLAVQKESRVIYVSDPSAVLELCKGKEAFVIGGEEIYKIFLPFCEEILVTHIKSSPQGDTFFPYFEKEFSTGSVLHENSQMKIVSYSRL